MIESMKVNKEIMRTMCDSGFITATELADFLTKKGVPFRESHGVVRRIVHFCQKQGLKLEQLSLKELKAFHVQYDKGALLVLDPAKVVKAKTSYGGTSPKSVSWQIKLLQRSLK